MYSSEKVINKFIKNNNIDSLKSFDDEIQLYANKFHFQNNNNIDFFDETINNLVIGDYCIITYIPASQKYIDECNEMTIEGNVIYLDIEYDDLWLLTKDNIVRSLEQPGFHFFGMSRCFFYNIKKQKI